MSHVKIWDDPITYTVEGSGDFPFDMLRRDMAWPTSSEDANLLGQRGRRRISLTARQARFVVVKRWESFGWRVIGADLFPYLEAARQHGVLEPA